MTEKTEKITPAECMNAIRAANAANRVIPRAQQPLTPLAEVDEKNTATASSRRLRQRSGRNDGDKDAYEHWMGRRRALWPSACNASGARPHRPHVPAPPGGLRHAHDHPARTDARFLR